MFTNTLAKYIQTLQCSGKDIPKCPHLIQEERLTFWLTS